MVKLMLWLDYRCNHNCVHCSVHEWRELYPKPITIDLANISADCVVLSGGEPTLSETFFDVIALPMKKTILTNADRISDDDFYKRLTACDLSNTDFIVSFHSSDKTTFEAITRTPGSYDRCLLGLKRLLQYQVSIKLVVTKLSLPTLVDTVNFLLSLKPDLEIDISAMIPRGVETGVELMPSISDLRPPLFDIFTETPPNVITRVNIPACALPMVPLYKYRCPRHFNSHKVSAIMNRGEALYVDDHLGDLLTHRKKPIQCAECTENAECDGVETEYPYDDIVPIRPFDEELLDHYRINVRL